MHRFDREELRAGRLGRDGSAGEGVAGGGAEGAAHGEAAGGGQRGVFDVAAPEMPGPADGAAIKGKPTIAS